MKTFEQIRTEIIDLSDVEKWKWLMRNQDQDITVMLDNDDTYILVERGEEKNHIDFGEFIGWTDGIFHLLEAAGIKCLSV